MMLSHKDSIVMKTYSQNGTWKDIDRARDDDFMYDIFRCSLNWNQSDDSSVDKSECTETTADELDDDHQNHMIVLI